ncbi:hypothetical protein [Dyella nitratireducens]|uniref:UrcA family protein n=1 Tax=Dyella nitratireducens TaxID=1849580 RepID=A0ABQ1GF31_9GAMM|nr:hypothetical protein [Dyella nitratireducens]GGA42526.1 hypothetical protein GCM10010981_34540 [Dyella nitratireducens]GLQ41989.1 hypothetical protein GCM10007902_18390 [Dyella nitratireducens]
MHTNARFAAMVVFALPAFAMAQTTHDASRIGGSIYPTVIQPSSLAAPISAVHAQPLATVQSINAVCLTSQANAERCPAQANMAFCDVDSVGLSHCLSHYANVLVKQPARARRTLSFLVRDASGAVRIVTVLATAKQRDEAIAKAALEGMSGAAIVATGSP